MEHFVTVLLTIAVILMAVTLYNTPRCTVEDIEVALSGFEFDIIE